MAQPAQLSARLELRASPRRTRLITRARTAPRPCSAPCGCDEEPPSFEFLEESRHYAAVTAHVPIVTGFAPVMNTFAPNLLALGIIDPGWVGSKTPRVAPAETSPSKTQRFPGAAAGAAAVPPVHPAGTASPTAM
jgi:hypothetical protein